MPLPPPNPAPYDTLATVTQLTRTILADYIRGLIPNPQGTCNADGVNLTWVSGPKFSAYFNGAQIQVNGVPNQVALVTSPTTLVLASAAATLTGIPWVATIETGDIFADKEAYVVPTVNLGWRKLQKKLNDKGHPRLEGEAIISNLPVIANLDPASQQWISWNGFYDGANFQNAPTLPGDFISPLRLWERPYVQGTNPHRFLPMHPAPDALRTRPKGSWNRYWDWHNDALYLHGCIIPMELRARYSSFLPDIVPAVGGFGSTVIPITRSADALAYYAAAEFVNPRGGVLGQTFEAKGDVALDQITNAFAKLQQRASFSRRAWGARGRRRGGFM